MRKKRVAKVLATFSVVAMVTLVININVSAKGKSRFEKLELFNKVLYLIESQYYREVDTEKLIEGALKGMMSTLDPHSAYLNKKVYSKMKEDTEGEFGGLGIEVSQKDGVLVVITPIDDTPAYKAGIKAGDKIVEIDHDSTVGLSLEQSVEKMRGKPNSKIEVGVLREGVKGIKRFSIRREIIKVKPVKSRLVFNNYAYIRLTQFQAHSAKYIKNGLKKIKKQAKKKGGLKGIVLDLRSNPGGLLDEAVNVSSLFLNDGVVVSTEGRDPKQKEIRYVKKGGYKETKLPIVVLINGASASASEIVAGALQDHDRAIILGSQSFGKGSVQTVAKIDDTQGVKLTIAQYMTPKNRKIQAIGIKPDIIVSEYEASWSKDNEVSSYIREKDLRNHLTATIESPSEKKERLAKEKEEREIRRKKLDKLKEGKKEGKSQRSSNPEEDYLVIQATKQLKAFEIVKKMVK